MSTWQVARVSAALDFASGWNIQSNKSLLSVTPAYVVIKKFTNPFFSTLYILVTPCSLVAVANLTA
jgi:hypothetical protein